MLTVDGRNGLPSSPKMTNTFSAFKQPVNAVMSPAATMPAQSAQSQAPHPQHRHMWIVTGPAGCGKSTVAAYLSKELQVPYIEGDDYHPAANRQKMSQGIPLSDVDRWDWLITLRDAAVSALSTSPTHTGVVVTCSALKRKYRDVIRIAAYNNHRVQVHFIYLHAPEKVLMARVAARKGHFMGASMVHSQFESLEAPDENEIKDVIKCDCSGNIAEVEQVVLAKVMEELKADDEGHHGDSEW